MNSALLRQMPDIQLWTFYGWWQLSVCLFAFMALMGIWWHIGRKNGDFGQVWLALSVLCWSFSGAVEVCYAKVQVLPASQLEGWRSILSLFNSLFILFSLPWFRYLPPMLAPMIKSKYWYYLVGLPFLFSLVPTLNKILFAKQYTPVSEFDVYFSILTLAFLGSVLWWSFAKRRLLILAYLSVLCILMTFVAQLFKLTTSEVDLTLFSAIFKTTLIMIFFALALSWVKELVENVLPPPSQLFLTLTRYKEQHKFHHLVSLQGIPCQTNSPIVLTPALFNLLLKFAHRKIDGTDWLEIKPKFDPRSGIEYDIKDHNEIKRLISSLLDGIFGKGCWTKEQHLQPLKDTLFELSETRSRKIRLKLPSDNITLTGV